jgi:hypothetical protein
MQLGVLGSGSSGVVLHALDTRADPPTEVAVKLIPRGEFVSCPPQEPAWQNGGVVAVLQRTAAPFPFPAVRATRATRALTDATATAAGAGLQDVSEARDSAHRQPQAPRHHYSARGGRWA